MAKRVKIVCYLCRNLAIRQNHNKSKKEIAAGQLFLFKLTQQHYNLCFSVLQALERKKASLCIMTRYYVSLVM